MAFWLAQQRGGQCTDWLQRFDPRFWTVDFPRPEMASIVSTAPDALRVTTEFHHCNALAGLIWDSTDRHDHPLTGYATDKDYARTVLQFRWRSAGVLPLDAVHGPTLVIEGLDAQGAEATWHVRLWNHAVGAPDDALVTLPFSELRDGWAPEANAPAIHPHAIERMFITLVPPAYDPADPALLRGRAEGWVELSGISCTGDRPLVAIGDVMLPPHGEHACTAYDDCYHVTPARLLRGVRALGYRGPLVHYMGMSHFFRLVPDADGALLVARDGALSACAEEWHRDFFRRCRAMDIAPVASLSYEVLAAHCPAEWQQRFADGTPGLTGWSPPSALLSPANGAAMAWLQAAARRMVGLMATAGLPVSFQIGEPWWWALPDGRVALYDAAARAAFSDKAPAITNLRDALTAEQIAVLDRAGKALAASTLALRDAVRDAAGGVAEVMLLLFTPTILAGEQPDLRRANCPAGWAWPAFDRLQLEDYDWLTDGHERDRLAAYDAVAERLAYPLAAQDYLAGFVLRAEDAAAQWPLIDAGLDEARLRGVPRRFVWAVPQINRDGYTRLRPAQEDDMQAFDDLPYPLALGQDAGVSAEFSTSVSLTASGHERRASHWQDARLHFDVGPGIRSDAELGTLIAFFRARRGAARGFRLRDPFDHSSNGMTGAPTPFDQLVGTGDGKAVRFRLAKSYAGPDPQQRLITRPVAASVLVSVDGAAIDGWRLEEGGWLVLQAALPAGAEVRAGFLFDVPVRFASDRLDIVGAAFAAGEAPSVPLVEVREAT
ncbi:DUF2460 domain-containing protein [Croceibacterium ferulae]|uniref:DUF2460 domain-containing protein n=1 Tax=Croceibacterium ferulae TaxID=1854641 RepID=UPI000EAED9E5|nr:DUF2460 domain-containing protein [Croceibacterium ferulae]